MPNRSGPVQDTHAVLLPQETHYEPARCGDVDCGQSLNGWKTIVPGDGPLAVFIRTRLRLSHTWRETAMPDGLVEFEFPPGQQCFRGLAGEHRQPSGRDPILVRRVGEGERRVLRPADWLDSLHETVEKAVQLVERW